MKYKLILITAFVVFAIAVSAQTTMEEYDYLTKGYKEDVARERGAMKGYELKHVNSIYEGNKSVEVGVVYRLKDTLIEKAAYLLIYKNATADAEYFCYPSPKSDTATIGRYWKQLNANSSSDTARKNLITYAIENNVWWPKYVSDTSEKYTIEPIFPGGLRGWQRYLERNLNPNLPAEKGSPNGRYSVTVAYSMDETGKITDVVSVNNPGYGTAEEALRVMRNSPKFFPALRDGHPVAFKGKQAFTFIVSDDRNIYLEENEKGYKKTKAKDYKLWQQYVQSNFNMAVPIYNGAPTGKYTVSVNFSVDSIGGISDAKVYNNPGYGIGEELMRVINNSPDWIPATKDGKPKKSWSNYIFNFKLKE